MTRRMESGDRSSRRYARRGFTIIEVMIVIAIILALSGLVGFALIGQSAKAKKGIAETQIRLIKSGIKAFYVDYGRFPSEDEGLAVLWNKSGMQSEEDQAKWTKYLESPVPTDPWGSAWGYRAESENREGEYDLWSYGPDKQDGTDDDINAFAAEDADAEGGSGGNLPPPPPSGG